MVNGIDSLHWRANCFDVKFDFFESAFPNPFFFSAQGSGYKEAAVFLNGGLRIVWNLRSNFLPIFWRDVFPY